MEKRLESGFEKLMAGAKAKGVKPKSVKEVRGAYFAGAAVMFNIFMQHGGSPQADFDTVVEEVRAEVEQFLKE